MADGENGFLLKRISELERELAATNAEAAKRRSHGKATAKELAEVKAERDTLVKERDALKTSPGEWQAKAEAIQKELMTRDHRDAWMKVIGEILQDRVPLDEVWGKIQYKVGENIPSEAEIKSQVKAAQEAAPYLFRQQDAGERRVSEPGPAASREAQPQTKGQLQVPFDASRGDRDMGQHRFTVRRSDMQNVEFMMANSQKIAKASRSGTLNVLPD